MTQPTAQRTPRKAVEPLKCPRCSLRLWLAPPSMGEQGIYFCDDQRIDGCGFSETQDENYQRRELPPAGRQRRGR